jgi:hypothetical protein
MDHEIGRRAFVGAMAVAAASPLLRAAERDGDGSDRPASFDRIEFGGCPTVEKALRIAAVIYAKNRRKDALSSFYTTGYRMTVSPEGFPASVCISPDFTFGLLGARYHPDDVYLKTLLGMLDLMPRNMRRNGRFFLNEDMLIGGERVMNQVMYPIWIWELYLATGDIEVVRHHREPLSRCLAYIESRTDRDGVVNQVDHDDWQLSEGADWVDWSPERLEGSTCVYHAWYARALAHAACIFEAAGDAKAAEEARSRHRRQRAVLKTRFWSGRQYYDNLNFAGRKVESFWCDSQLWPIAYGFALKDQAATVFSRIDAQPEFFEGVPIRWCVPVPDEVVRDLARSYPDMPPEPHLRPFTWFGRLGAGDILARRIAGQDAHAFKLLHRYCDVVVRHGTCPECLDMDGIMREGTSGGRDYLEHAGGLLLAAGRGIWGIDDTADGSIVWKPFRPPEAKKVSLPFWYKGRRWTFGYEDGGYWIDPDGARETVKVIFQGKAESVQVDGKRVVIRQVP